MQTNDAQMAVIGLTANVNGATLLEKRVNSRFSGRHVFVPPGLATVPQCQRLLRKALAAPCAHSEEAPELAPELCVAWAARMELLVKEIALAPWWSLALAQSRLTPRQLLVASRVCLSEVCEACETPTPSLRPGTGQSRPPTPPRKAEGSHLLRPLLRQAGRTASSCRRSSGSRLR